MKFHALLALTLLTTAVFAQTKAAAPPPPVTYNQAVANEKNLFAADQKHDMDAIKSMVADDFIDINKDGSSEDKATLLKEIPTLKLLHYEQKNFRVVSMGPYAYLISYDSDATVLGADGKEKHVQNDLNTVWIWRDGRWQILLHCRGEQKILGAEGGEQGSSAARIQIKKMEIPHYPPLARQAGISGQVTLLLTLNNKGEVTSVALERAEPTGWGRGFASTAIEAAKKSQFSCPSCTGDNFEHTVTYQFAFPPIPKDACEPDSLTIPPSKVDSPSHVTVRPMAWPCVEP